MWTVYWCAQSDREMGGRMDKGPEMLADVIPKVLGFNAPFLNIRSIFFIYIYI